MCAPTGAWLQRFLTEPFPDKLSDEEEQRGYCEAYARDLKFISRRVGQNPDDHHNRENRNEARTGKSEWCAIAADIAPAQFERSETAKNVK